MSVSETSKKPNSNSFSPQYALFLYGRIQVQSPLWTIQLKDYPDSNLKEQYQYALNQLRRLAIVSSRWKLFRAKTELKIETWRRELKMSWYDVKNICIKHNLAVTSAESISKRQIDLFHKNLYEELSPVLQRMVELQDMYVAGLDRIDFLGGAQHRSWYQLGAALSSIDIQMQGWRVPWEVNEGYKATPPTSLSLEGLVNALGKLPKSDQNRIRTVSSFLDLYDKATSQSQHEQKRQRPRPTSFVSLAPSAKSWPCDMRPQVLLAQSMLTKEKGRTHEMLEEIIQRNWSLPDAIPDLRFTLDQLEKHITSHLERRKWTKKDIIFMKPFYNPDTGIITFAGRELYRFTKLRSQEALLLEKFQKLNWVASIDNPIKDDIIGDFDQGSTYQCIHDINKRIKPVKLKVYDTTSKISWDISPSR
ncbi:MAG: hypothetical protein JNJ77_18650 [Planctomycetia bacterium]|nr:hypothetical protein [Planctomycetia bacterium]